MDFRTNYNLSSVKLTFFFKYFFIVFLFFTQILSAQPTFTAHCDTRQVMIDEPIEVAFTLANATGTKFSPPIFTDFRVRSGPNQAVSTNILNGRMTRSFTFSYILQPKSVGKFTIGAASIVADGTMMKTSPIAIEVQKATPPTAGGTTAKGKTFIKASISNTDARLGQQLVLQYKLYTMLDVQNMDMARQPSFQGFFMKDIMSINDEASKETINGKTYTTKVIKRVALFPQQEGSIVIEPAAISIAVAKKENQDDDGFGGFFNMEFENITVETNPLTVNVKSIADAPADFSGAVGKYDVLATMSKTTLTTDDATILRLNILGNGDIKRVLPPKLQLSSDSLEIYAPKVIEEDTYESGGEMIGKKVVAYQILPKYAGKYLLQGKLTYFDTETMRFQTIATDKFDVVVAQGTGKRVAPQVTSPTAAPIQEAPLQETSSDWIWSLVAASLLGLLGYVLWQKRTNLPTNATKTELVPSVQPIKKTTNQPSSQRLTKAKGYLQLRDTRKFYDEIVRTLQDTVSEKLKIEKVQMSKENIAARFMESGSSPSVTEQYFRVIENCEKALYAGQDYPEAMQDAYAQATEILGNLEK
jgi:BatD DUF11 like domain